MKRTTKIAFSLAGLAAAGLAHTVLAQGGSSVRPSSPALEELARAAARPHLERLAARHGLAGLDDLRETRLRSDRQGLAHLRIQQAHGGVAVLGGEAIVHLRSDGSLFAVTDDLVPRVRADLRRRITLEEAEQAAVAAYGCAECLTARPETRIWILRQDGADRLAYEVRLRREDGTADTALPVIFIDARTGEEVWRYDNLQTVGGTGKSLYSGTVPVETFKPLFAFYMEDLGRKVGTFDSRNQTLIGFRFRDTDNVWDSPSQTAGVDAHHGASLYHDYFLAVHGRNGLDGAGGPGNMLSVDGVTRLITARVHYGNAFNNAIWNGRMINYGDGDGVLFSPLVTLDIVGHESTHGINQFEARLFNFGEPGALNESWADVFGSLLERSVRGETAGTWRIGEQCFTPGNGEADAIRHLDDPHLASDGGFTADDDPDHYSERFIGLADNAGVHINAGIPNKAFYLLANGGTHHLGGSMTGIGVDDAARIWYEALTNYMTAFTNFAGARQATLSAAASLFGPGSPQQTAVGQAWCLVGVGGGC